MTVREQLFARRRALQLSRQALVEKMRATSPALSFHPTSLQRWERGDGAPSPEQLAAWMASLDVSADEAGTVLLSALDEGAA